MDSGNLKKYLIIFKIKNNAAGLQNCADIGAWGIVVDYTSGAAPIMSATTRPVCSFGIKQQIRSGMGPISRLSQKLVPIRARTELLFDPGRGPLYTFIF